MSSKVDMFLQESGGTTFTETAPRPPVPGEENEKESNGGMSTKSSGSHRSQVSQTSCRSMGSTKGDINPATPRKSNIEKPAVSNVTCCFDEEMDAPLGFEPEGSVTNSPPFTENSTPPYLKWAESLQNLLEDHDGVTLFKEFLGQEDVGTASVDFWFACQGLKKNAQITEHSQVVKLMKTISKRYIKGERLPFVDGDTKRTIAEGINLQHEDNIDVTLFDAAQTQVETYMKNETYPLFLNSNLYLSYVSREGDSPKSSNSSIGSNSASRPVSSGPLPTVKEDQELRNDDFAVPFSVGPPTTRHHSRTAPLEAVRPDVLSTPYLSHRSQAVPYHNSYAPVSAQDSEIQSLSSQDTFSEDAQSVTDSRMDTHTESGDIAWGTDRIEDGPASQTERMSPLFQWKQLGKRPERLANVKNRNIAETNCKQFAELLSKRLMEVLAERESKERFQEAMNRSDISETMEKTCLSSSSVKNATSTSFGPLLQSSMIDEENADSILEEHCSRIWESSAGQTPSRSPGRSRSPDRFRKPAVPPTGTSSMPGTLHVKTSQSKKRTNSTMSHSLASFDSGMGDDAHKQCVSHKHYHHHHHHHHEKRKTKQKLEWQAQEHSKVCIGDVSTPHHGGRGTRTRSAPRTSSDAYSNLDSGISMVESCQTTQDNSLMADPAKSKYVFRWYRLKLKYSPGAG
ncbi:AXIN1-like protein [Mya arenaria]|uniref:AXIN1-like protein n=1 Tax=Mya arenaria TaxID=6604 RepID=A0ABY7DI86_MYAAR|nr:AXIN1-like protein [Mya arenaria]